MIAIWQQLNYTGGFDSIFSNYSTDGGKTWHTDVEVDNLTDDYAYNPYIALDGNHAVAIWQPGIGRLLHLQDTQIRFQFFRL